MRYARTREADLLTPTAQCTNILAGKKEKKKITTHQEKQYSG